MKRYNIEGVVPWSKIVRQRRMKFIGHILRLDSETPIRKALRKCFTNNKFKQGRPKTTWIRMIYNDFSRILGSNRLDIDFLTKLTDVAKDREKFDNTVKSLME